jgi:hypothetical protein
VVEPLRRLTESAEDDDVLIKRTTGKRLVTPAVA